MRASVGTRADRCKVGPPNGTHDFFGKFGLSRYHSDRKSDLLREITGELLLETGIFLDEYEWDVANKLLGQSDRILSLGRIGGSNISVGAD